MTIDTELLEPINDKNWRERVTELGPEAVMARYGTGLADFVPEYVAGHPASTFANRKKSDGIFYSKTMEDDAGGVRTEALSNLVKAAHDAGCTFVYGLKSHEHFTTFNEQSINITIFFSGQGLIYGAKHKGDSQ